jgi:UDP-N-acetylmuramoyl-tripeptide--D-alanyl-D-alanine ligase
LGAAADEMHRKIGILMATIGVNAVFLQGDFASMMAAGALEGGMAEQNIFFLSAAEDGMSYLKQHLKKGDWVLVKGSRGMKMEKIVAQICGLFGLYESGTRNNSCVNQPGVNQN